MATKRKIDMTGEKYGRLTVVKEKPITDYPNNKRKCVQWYCNCDCGTQNVLVDGIQLRRGHVKSCGCYNKEMSMTKNAVDITGNKYGKLTVVKRVAKPEDVSSSKRGAWWLCKCECGNETVVHGNALRTCGTISCGCTNSKAELIIRKLLNDNLIKYETQYRFNDLRSEITNWVLKFDFAIFNDLGELSFLLEYDGEQHVNGTRFSPRKEENEEKFMKTKTYDKQKNDYCNKKNIDLLRIPHWEFDQIEEILINKLKEKEII